MSKHKAKVDPYANEPTVEEELLGALAEFTDALKKDEVTQRFTCRQIKLNLRPTAYNPALVKKTRNLLGVSQTLFAMFLGVSPKTVRTWEQGLSEPSMMAARFMDEIRGNPKHWLDRLQEMIVTKEM